jgi:hypothetical protein
MHPCSHKQNAVGSLPSVHHIENEILGASYFRNISGKKKIVIGRNFCITICEKKKIPLGDNFFCGEKKIARIKKKKKKILLG